jgi:adenylate cyclase
MNTKDVKRKLRAILSADVQGYSRLMGDDEVATVKTITEYRETLTSLVNQYNGRVVDSPGDNVLAEFGSVVDAVQCAVEIQHILKARNEELPENRRMIFRIGVNLGDVIQDGDRIYGDGVNIAARIESLADGGGICISGTAYDQIENKLALGYHFIGEHSVKNIAKPVRVYKVPMDPKDVGKKRAAKPWKKMAIAAAVLLILAGAAAAVWKFYPRPAPTGLTSKQTPPESTDKPLLTLSDKPSIAVLPFANLSGDPEQEYFSDGMAEEIITALSKIPKLFVIARNSSFTYKGKPVMMQQVGKELGVKYVLEGSVRKSGDRVRIMVQLIDAQTGRHLWAERYDRDLKNIFALQDEITLKVISALQVKLTAGEQARLFGKGTENLEAYLRTLQALMHFNRLNKQGNMEARRLAKEAIAMDPEYAGPYRVLALTHMMDVWFNFSKSPKESMTLAGEAVQKALALDDSHPGAHIVLCFLYIMQKKHDKAIAAAERAVELSPSGADAYAALGGALRYACRPNEAIPMVKKAMSLNPMANTLLLALGRAYQMAGKYEDAIVVLKKSLQEFPNGLFPHLHLAVCYVSLGREEQARAEAREILRIHPEFSLEHFAKIFPYKDQSVVDHMIARLRKAGLK